jgi:hypothetical protein
MAKINYCQTIRIHHRGEVEEDPPTARGHHKINLVDVAVLDPCVCVWPVCVGVCVVCLRLSRISSTTRLITIQNDLFGILSVCMFANVVRSATHYIISGNIQGTR